MMFDAFFGKPFCFIGVIVKSNNHCDSEFFKDWDIIGRCKDSILKSNKKYSIFVNGFVIRGTECYELVGNDPVEITVLNFLIMLIFIKVKFFKVEPF